MHDGLLGWVNPLDAFDPWRNSRVHVGPHRKVLGLLRNSLGQCHLAGRLLSHVRRLWKPLGLSFCVRKTIALSSLPSRQLNHSDLGADMWPISTTSTVGPVHDSPLHPWFGVLRPSLEGCHSGCLWGVGGLLHIHRFDMEDFVWQLSQMLQWSQVLPLMLHISTRWDKVYRFGLNISSGDILVFDKKSGFHILPALCPWKGQQWVTIGG